MSDDAYAALRTVGGTGDTLVRHEGFVLIGRKGLAQGTAIFERIGGASALHCVFTGGVCSGRGFIPAESLYNHANTKTVTNSQY